jgi:hypothetical protein
MKHDLLSLGAIGGLVVGGLLGCEKREIRTYTTKKEVEPAPAMPPPAPAARPQAPAAAVTAPPAVDAAPGRWPIPEGWKVVPGQKPMRLATFEAGAAGGTVEVVLSEFPGDAGGLLANINRWRAQVGLPAGTLQEIEAEAVRIDAAPVNGHVVHLRGEQSHMLGAVLNDSKAGRTRFVKATGSPATIEALRPSFEQFARSVASMKEAD